MFTLVVIPFAFGYLVATRVLRERQWQLCLPVAYALALTFFLCSVNVLFRFFSLKQSVWMTLGLIAVVSAGLLRLKSDRCSTLRLGKLEAAVVIILAMTASFWALFWQMRHSDDDFFPHAPIMAFFLRDIFPPRNPLYPQFTLQGHYGRDLIISALSVLFGGRFFQVQYITTALSQAALVCLIYFASRRYLRSWRAALLGVVLAFLGVNEYMRRGLIDTFGNNNSFAYLLLFLNMYLYFVALTRRDVGSKVVSALSLGTYAIVYETHYGVLLIAFSAWPFILLARRRRWQPRYIGVTGFIVAASLAIAVIQGGALSEVAKRQVVGLTRLGAPGSTADFALAEQHVSVRFPKSPIGITSFDGTEYSIFSSRLVREGGRFVAFLPLVTLSLLILRRYWGVLVGLVSMLAIAVPATVDFGAFNGESFRFLFFAGVTASVVFGASVGLWLDWLSGRGRVPVWAAVGVIGLLLFTCSKSTRVVLRDVWDVWKRSEEYFWSAEEWACNGITQNLLCDPLDVRAAMKLRSLIQPGERLLTNMYLERMAPTLMAHSIVSIFSGAYVDGHGIRISKDQVFAMSKEYMAPAGFRAMAFWNTGDMSILQGMRVTYLLVDPARLSPKIYARLRNESRLELLDRESDARLFQVREVYRVRLDAQKYQQPLPFDVEVVSADFPSIVRPKRFYEIPFVLTVGSSSFDGQIEVGYRILFGDLMMNAGDEVRHVVKMTRSSAGQWMGKLFFVGPYDGGEYTVELYAVDAGGPHVLRQPSGQRARYHVEVK
jgi:hypothetical protein